MAESGRDSVNLSVEAEANKRRALAEAEADAAKVKAAADADAAKHHADGDAYAARTVALAEAEAINARASALDDGNQALIAANRLVDILPELVEAAARGIADSNLTILSGTEGVNQAVAGVVGQGLQIYETLRRSIASTNGSAPIVSGSDSGNVPEELTSSIKK